MYSGFNQIKLYTQLLIMILTNTPFSKKLWIIFCGNQRLCFERFYLMANPIPPSSPCHFRSPFTVNKMGKNIIVKKITIFEIPFC